MNSFYANDDRYDWNWGLQQACKDGNLQIVNFMLSKGATDYNWVWQMPVEMVICKSCN